MGAKDKLKVLNLYAGIGGNRKLWTNCEVTAVEIEPKIAEIYKTFFPDDTVIVGDAHEYLLEHFEEYDFIWSSPPCPTHSQLGRLRALSDCKETGAHTAKAKYPDMKLYEEILLLKHYFGGKYCVENVIAYYEPLIIPQVLGRHHYWANFQIKTKDIEPSKIEKGLIKDWEKMYGYDLSGFINLNKRKALRNCVEPEIGLWIFENAQGILREENQYQLNAFNSERAQEGE
jgi:DNA (cytosine-5)-methyltransferase 1